MHQYKQLITIGLKDQKNLFIFCVNIIVFSTIVDYLFVISSYPFLHFLNDTNKLDSVHFIYLRAKSILHLDLTEKEFWIFVWIILAISSVLMKLIYVWLKAYTSNMFGYHISRSLMQSYGSQTYEAAQTFNENSVTSAVAAKINLLVKGTVQPLFNILQAIVSLFILLIVLLMIGEYIILLILGSILSFYLCLTIFFKHKLKDLSSMINNTQTRQLEFVSSVQRGYKDLYVNNALFKTISNYSKNELILRNSLIKANLISELPRYLLELFVFSIIGLFLLYYSLGNGAKFNPVYIGTIIVGFARVVPIFQLGFVGYAHFKSSTDVLREFEDMFDKLKRGVKIEICDSEELKEFQKITMKINYHCDGPERPKFHDLVLNVKKGQKLALIGASGSGKSSLINLFIGLNKIQDGMLLVDDGKQTKTLDDLRGYVSFVPQEIYISDGTVKENLVIYSKDNTGDEELIETSLRLSFPEKNNLTEYGSSSELSSKKGKTLSGGERQRLAFARAFFQRKGLMLIDEGTTGLDHHTKNRLLDEIFSNNNLSVIFITHDREILSRFEKVLSLENGKLKEVSVV